VPQANENWYALRVKARSERLIAMMVRHKGYEGFVPVYRSARRWSDRTKVVEMPLFPGYVFCRLNPILRLPLLTIPGVLHFVGVRNTPTPIDEGEIATIQIAIESGLAAEPWPYVEDGQRVTVQGGPLKQVEGRLATSQNPCRLVVAISLLRRSVAVEIDRAWVKSIAEPTDAILSPLSLQSTELSPSNGQEG
jgi:transcription antitermination factor NusG